MANERDRDIHDETIGDANEEDVLGRADEETDEDEFEDVEEMEEDEEDLDA